MEVLLAILLYLHLIISPGTYYQSQIEQLEINHLIEIDQVRTDPVLYEQVLMEYMDQAGKHVIIETQTSN